MNIYCPIRQKFVKKTPEEIIRQYIIKLFLLKGFDRCLFRVERQIPSVNNLKYRPDVVIYDKNYQPYIIIECKADNIKISDKCFEQISIYNSFLNAKYLIITNGINIYTLMNKENKYVKIKIDEISNK